MRLVVTVMRIVINVEKYKLVILASLFVICKIKEQNDVKV